MATSQISEHDGYVGNVLSKNILLKKHADITLNVIESMRAFIVNKPKYIASTIFGCYTRSEALLADYEVLDPVEYNTSLLKYFSARIESTGNPNSVDEIINLHNRMKSFGFHISRELDEHCFCFEYNLFETDSNLIFLILKHYNKDSWRALEFAECVNLSEK